MRPVVSLLLVGALTYPAYAQSAAMRGFLTKDIADEQKIEQQAQAIPDPARLRKYMDFLAAEPEWAIKVLSAGGDPARMLRVRNQLLYIFEAGFAFGVALQTK